MKQLRLPLERKRQAGDALRLANAVYQQIRDEPLDQNGHAKRDLLKHAVEYLEIFCLSIAPK